MHDADTRKQTFDSAFAERVLEQIPTPIMAVNKDFEIIFMNAEGRALLGANWEKINGRHCYEVMHSVHCNTPD